MRHPLLLAEEYGDLYALSSDDHWTKSTLRPDQKRIRDYLLQALPVGGSVLDVGCSSGDLLDSLGSPFRKFGIEPSAAARTRAQGLGIDVIAESVDALATSHLKFNAITAVDVIEHLPDPLAFLLQLADHLADDGKIVVSTGNCDAFAWKFCGPSYYYAHLFEHVSFISERWCNYVAYKGFYVEVLEATFPHLSAEHESLLARTRKYALFLGKLVPAWLERVLLTRLPTVANRLGPRLMLGEPGMFNDHILVVFSRVQHP